MLHIVMLKRARRRDFLEFILATLAGSAEKLSNVVTVTGQQVSISADSVQVVQADGDIATTLPAKIAMPPVSLCP
jgi:diacylglycerol kinase family enzyme